MLSQAIHCAVRDSPIQIQFDQEKAEKDTIDNNDEIIVSCTVKFDKEQNQNLTEEPGSEIEIYEISSSNNSGKDSELRAEFNGHNGFALQITSMICEQLNG